MTQLNKNSSYAVSPELEEHVKHCKLIKPDNKILKILILGGGPIGLFAGYKLLKKGNEITIFEKRKKYTRHNILSLKETTKLDTLSIIPSEIMEELDSKSSFSHLNADISETNKKCYKNVLREKPYLMVSSRIYYIVLNELENAYEKHFKLHGGTLIRPETAESYSNIKIENNLLYYSEDSDDHVIDMSKYDIVFINDGSNSFYRNIYFEKTSYTEHNEPNILKYGLTKENNTISVANNLKELEPLGYGLILIYNIEDKEDFQDKFKTEDKFKNKIDFDAILKLENKDDDFLKGLSVKEILVENSANKENITKQLNSQNLFRMFVSENYLYISIMVNPKDVGDFASKIQNQNILFDDLPNNLQIYLMFALYYYDLSELIDPRSKNNNIRMFPLNFGCVKQSCTLIKKDTLVRPVLERKESFAENISDMDIIEKCSINYVPNNKSIKNYYQFVTLCGDAMASGNFHAGIVLNRNLVAVNNICQHIDEYIDSYPKDINGNLNSNFLRLLFFHGNFSNQKARNEIITKSIDALVNFDALDKDESVFNLSQILTELNEIILCKNCIGKNKLMCKNSASFVKFIVDNSKDEVLQRILKYLFLPDKYKYSQALENIFNIEATDSTFE